MSGASQHPGHLTRLKDGRLLVTYGNRIKGQQGVLARLSADEGKTWGEPLTLVNDLVSGDCGYPATAQMRDGKILQIVEGTSQVQRVVISRAMIDRALVYG